MQIIDDYIIVELKCSNVGFVKKPNTKEDFEKLIKDKINQGFQPYGNMIVQEEKKSSILATKRITKYIQVMVKYK